MTRSPNRRFTSAHAIAFVALVLAVGGGSFAIAARSGPQKKVVKKIARKQANKQITRRAPKLSVKHAGTANTAVNAGHAGNADTATTAGSAQSAGVAAALTPGEAVHLVGAAGEPSFQGSWTNGTGAPVGFFKDREGIVHLQGNPGGGVSSTAVFILPAGYRPTSSLFMPAADHGLTKLMVLRVDTNGEAVMFCSGGCPSSSIGIDGLSFRAG